VQPQLVIYNQQLI